MDGSKLLASLGGLLLVIGLVESLGDWRFAFLSSGLILLVHVLIDEIRKIGH